jgi:hypothetical protein
VLFRERQLQAKCVFMEDTKRRLLLKKQIQRECIWSKERDSHGQNVYLWKIQGEGYLSRN